MPELAEVEHFRGIAHRVAHNQRIIEVRCAWDPIVLQPLETLEAHLKHRRVLDVHRHGKYLWFELDIPPHPIFHFGMTGRFRTPQQTPIELAHGTPNQHQWPPAYTKLHFVFDTGAELAFTNPRRLGKIRLAHRPHQEAPLSNLGFDPFLNMPALDLFIAQLKRYRGNIKGVLLNQKFAAGIGNWLADDILYEAGVAPHREVPSLNDADIGAIRSAMSNIVTLAVQADAQAARFPTHWLFHRRWKKRGTVTSDRQAIEYCKVAGRVTAWVPSRQR